MVRRIDTLRSLKQRRSYAQKLLDAGLARHRMTLQELRQLCDLDDRLSGDGFNRGLISQVESLEQDIELRGHEWAIDDWPHARLRGCPRSGHIITSHDGKHRATTFDDRTCGYKRTLRYREPNLSFALGRHRVTDLN